jgi:Ca-activated chloride channel family protein
MTLVLLSGMVSFACEDRHVVESDQATTPPEAVVTDESTSAPPPVFRQLTEGSKDKNQELRKEEVSTLTPNREKAKLQLQSQVATTSRDPQPMLESLSAPVPASMSDIALYAAPPPVQNTVGQPRPKQIPVQQGVVLESKQRDLNEVDVDPITVEKQSGEFNREEYNPIDENDFLSPMTSPLSTFSIDVDTASYSNMRRFLQQGQLPPPDAIRIEELINYFDYNYPNPGKDHPFTVVAEVSQTPWNPTHKLVHVGIQGKRVDTKDLAPNNLVFLIDVSGSMAEPNKLPLLKSSLQLLINELRPQDRVSIVVYAGAAGVVLPPTSGNEKATILAALDRLEAGGSTAGGEGIQLAYSLAEATFLKTGNNRVILASDGDFNVGVSSEAELVRLIEEKRKSDVFLTVLGFGTGDFQDNKMEQLANHGNGNYAYIDNLLEAQKALVNELGATLLTIAKDVKIQVEFNPKKVQAYRLIGYENRLLSSEDFNDDTKDAGELGAGHSVTALYEIIPVGVKSEVEIPTVDPLRYQSTDTLPLSTQKEELMLVKLRYKQPTGDVSQLIQQPLLDLQIPLAKASSDFRFAAAVAEFGLLLRNSKFKGEARARQVLELAEGSVSEDGYRREFMDLVQQYQALSSER